VGVCVRARMWVTFARMVLMYINVIIHSVVWSRLLVQIAFHVPYRARLCCKFKLHTCDSFVIWWFYVGRHNVSISMLVKSSRLFVVTCMAVCLLFHSASAIHVSPCRPLVFCHSTAIAPLQYSREYLLNEHTRRIYCLRTSNLTIQKLHKQ